MLVRHHISRLAVYIVELGTHGCCALGSGHVCVVQAGCFISTLTLNRVYYIVTSTLGSWTSKCSTCIFVSSSTTDALLFVALSYFCPFEFRSDRSNTSNVHTIHKENRGQVVDFGSIFVSKVTQCGQNSHMSPCTVVALSTKAADHDLLLSLDCAHARFVCWDQRLSKECLFDQVSKLD